MDLPHALSLDTDMVYVDERYECRFYVEGCATSAGINDTELKVTYTRDSTNFIDRLKLTVVDVVIDDPAEDEAVAVLISKTPGMGDDYPEPELQTQDRLIRIKAHTEPSVPDLPVHFKVWDPDDESPYEEDSLGDDNADGLGTIYAVPGYGYEGEPGPSLLVYSDPNGNIKVKLEITDHAAGDNYFVTACAMKQPDETDDASGKMIAWKRVYLEMDRMYKVGADFVDDFLPDADTSPDTVNVADTSAFSIGDRVILFDADHTGGELASVAAKTSTSLTLDADLVNSYHAGYPILGAPATFSRKGAAVALVSAGHFEITDTRLTDAFGLAVDGSDGGAFVEFARTPAGHGPVPFRHGSALESVSFNRYGWARLWFGNWNAPNTVCVTAASIGIRSGLCTPVFRLEYVFVGFLMDHYSDNELQVAIAHTVVHETGHQWLSAGTDERHPKDMSPIPLDLWCHMGQDSDYCAMSYGCGLTPAHSEFCASPEQQSICHHLEQIRKATDPLW